MTLAPPDDYQPLQTWLQSHAAEVFTNAPAGGICHTARAPGRLDLMGGIADYSGSLVLEMPIAAAAYAVVAPRTDGQAVVVSVDPASPGAMQRATVPVSTVIAQDTTDYPRIRKALLVDASQAWAAYALGAASVLTAERNAAFEQGFTVLLWSAVPQGAGVSSSAAVEVASMRALASLVDVTVESVDLGLLAQRVENHLVGAPCGVMDQLTSACGQANALLAIRCQPAQILDSVNLPPGLTCWGIDSGVKHAVTGHDYSTVRTAAAMGYRIIADQLGLAFEPTTPGHGTITDPIYHGYLANIRPSVFTSQFASHLPNRILGQNFLDYYQGVADPLAVVNADVDYPLAAATAHPVFENHRVECFAALLAAEQNPAERDRLLGEWMYQSHASYGTCGLGSKATDALVQAVRHAGEASGLFGAKITGGGSGGVVALLGHPDAEVHVQRIANEHHKAFGHGGRVISGSSPGALATPVMQTPLA